MATASQLRRHQTSAADLQKKQDAQMARRRTMDRWESIVCVIALVSCMNPFLLPILPYKINAVLKPLMWAVVTFLVLMRPRHTLYVISRSWLLWLVLALEVGSFSWSVNIESSFFSARDFAGLMSLGLYMGSRFSLRDQFHLAVWALSIVTGISLIAVFLFPAIGVHTDGDFLGAWRGVSGHKNALGSYASTLLICTFLLAVDPEKKKPIAWLGVVFSAFMVLKTTSTTALIISVVALSMVYFCCNFRWRGKKAILILDLAIMTAVTTLGSLLFMWVPLVEGLGKDASLSGRVPIWTSILEQFPARPWIGFGRGGYFAPGSPYSQQTAYDIGFWIPHSHNGFLEMLLDIGILGTTVFAIVFVLAYGKAIQRVFVARCAGDFFPLALLIVLTINNLTESFLFYQTSIYQVLLVSSIQALSRPRPPDPAPVALVPESSR